MPGLSSRRHAETYPRRRPCGKRRSFKGCGKKPSREEGRAIRAFPSAVPARRTCHSGFSVCRPCKEDTLFALSRVSPLQGGYAIRVFPCAVAAGKGGRGPRGGRPRPGRRRPGRPATAGSQSIPSRSPSSPRAPRPTPARRPAAGPPGTKWLPDSWSEGRASCR